MSDSHGTRSLFNSTARLLPSVALLALVGCHAPGGGVKPSPSSGEGPAQSSTLDPQGAPRSQEHVVADINSFLQEAQQDLLHRRELASQGVSTESVEAPRVLAVSEDSGSTTVPPSEIESAEATALAVPQLEPAVLLDSIPEDFFGPPQPQALSPDLDPLKVYVRTLIDSASTSDAPLRQHLTLAMLLGMTDPEQVFKAEGLAELTDSEQDLVRITHERFQSLGRELDDGGDATSVVLALQELIEQVEAEQPFRVSRLDLCTKVQDYGVVDAVDPPIFDPSERPGFIWYLELDGFEPAREAESGAWLYEFDLRLEMLTRDTGIPVIAPIEGTVRHRATSEVRDFYLRDLFRIPSDLQFDWYTAKITVIERKTGAQAQKSSDLLWVPNLAAGEAHLQRHAVVNP